MEAPKGGGKGGYKESGLHVLYLLANSLVFIEFLESLSIKSLRRGSSMLLFIYKLLLLSQAC